MTREATDYSQHEAVIEAARNSMPDPIWFPAKELDEEHCYETQFAERCRIIAAAVSKVLDPIRNALEGCGGCDYSESDGGLFRHCDSCLEQIARTAWELCTAPNPDEASR